MSGQSRFSIWKGDPALDSWYNAAVGRDASLRTMEETAGEEILFFDIAKSNQVKYPSDGANNWFYGSAIGDPTIVENAKIHAQETGGTSPMLNVLGLVPSAPASSGLTTDKPLPPIPNSPIIFAPDWNTTPYFEYIFADAGVENRIKRGKYSPDNVSFEVDDDVIEDEMSMDDDSSQVYDVPSPEVFVPTTPEYSNDAVNFHDLDDAGFTTHAFVQAGISITSKELAENYRATAGHNATGHFRLDEADEAEKAAASAGFYGGFTVEESPSPYHAPVIDQASGFGDIRDRAEAFPKQWQDNERRPKAYTLEEADAMVVDYPIETVDVAIRPILMPASRKRDAVENRHGRRNSPMFIDLTADDSSQCESNGTGKKRKAHDSTVTKSIFDTSGSEDDDVQHLYTKKVRVNSNDANDGEVEMIRRPSTYSLITIPETENDRTSPKSETASAIFAKIEPAPVGYPGQFASVMTLEQAMRDHLVSGPSPADRHTTIMSDYLHPNFLFTHTNFHPCEHEDKLDYRMRTARPGTQIFRSLEYADELTAVAADTPRAPAEELLRREVHRECAFARLEGMSVGEYRYYQGHLNVEEYKEAGMCVCWEICECSKPCTRFADMLCPCSKYIEMHKV